MMAAQRVEYKKIKAELREARTGDRFRRQSGGLFFAAGVPVKSTICVHSSAEEGNRSGICVMCRCLGGVAFGAATRLAQQGYVGNPQSAVEELANFCDVSSSRELRTNPPVIDGVAKSWNVGGVATSPEGWCAGSCGRRAWRGCQPRPKAHNYRACRRPGRSPRPDRKELHSRCSSSGNWWVTSPIFTPGKDSCTRQAATRPLCLKRIVGYATAGKHANRPASKTFCKIGGSELPAHQGCDDFSCRV